MTGLNACRTDPADPEHEGRSYIAKRLECVELAPAFERSSTSERWSKLLHLIRIAGAVYASWALLVNPARGGLFIEPGPYNASQTPLGVTCESSPLLCHRERVNRSPLTGFESGITHSGHYKQATPKGVLGQQTAGCKDACKVQSKLHALQTLRDLGRPARATSRHESRAPWG